MGAIIGWVGVGLGMLVPIPQLIKIIKTRRLSDISLGTYTLLVLCMCCYLVHAIHIKSAVFTTAQAVNLSVNSTIWIFLLKHRLGGKV